MAISVGFIGVGNMGNPMAGNVLKAGFPFTVFDRNPAAMSNLVAAGARKAGSAGVAGISRSSSRPAPAALDTAFPPPDGSGSAGLAGVWLQAFSTR